MSLVQQQCCMLECCQVVGWQEESLSLMNVCVAPSPAN